LIGTLRHFLGDRGKDKLHGEPTKEPHYKAWTNNEDEKSSAKDSA